jgi:hypothetical protein
MAGSPNVGSGWHSTAGSANYIDLRDMWIVPLECTLRVRQRIGPSDGDVRPVVPVLFGFCKRLTGGALSV